MAADVKPAQQSVSQNLPKEERYDHRAKRTQAVAKHTLFGSVIETIDEDDKKSLQQINVKEIENKQMTERLERKDRYKPKLPDHLKNQLPGESILQYKKEELAKQAQQVSRARGLINTLEEKSKYFAVGSKMEEEERSYRGRPHQWMTEKDLLHAGEINIVGLNNNNFNHDKYQTKPPVHQYSVIGDPLKLGMDCSKREKKSTPSGVNYEKAKAPDWLPKECYMAQRDVQEKSGSAISLPPNIQHLFGTKICNSVLSDGEKIKRTIEAQNKLKSSFCHRKEARNSRHILSASSTDPAYEELGGALRQNVFPGHTYDHKRSLARSVYTDDVHKHRHPDPEQYRYQRDALSTWNEYNTIYLRQLKKWEEYSANAPKFEANWDRNAPRPVPTSKAPEPKMKPKAKPKAAKPKAKEPAFEDVVFKTPPITPPPPAPDPIPIDNPVKKDDKFWDFYAQGV